MRRALLLALAAAFLLPLAPVPEFWITLLDYIGLYSLVTIGLVLLTGVAGLISFGQAAFVGIGAYTSAVLTTNFGLSPWATLPIALALTGASAAAIGALTVRLSGHYLPLGTIAWSLSLFYLFGNLEFVGAHDGLSGIPPLTLGFLSLASGRAMFPLIWLAVVAAIAMTANLLDSRMGRAIRALKTGAAAARSCGVDVAGARLAAFIIAAMLAGLSGWLYAHLQRAVSPNAFNLGAGIEYLLMAVVGGAGSVFGGVLGAGLVTLLRDQLQSVLPRLLGTSGNFEAIAFGAALVAMLQLAPAGLWPLLRAWVLALTGKKPGGVAIVTDGEGLPHRTMPARGAPLLLVERLRKTFGGLVAVNDVAFAVSAGEIVGLIGPNGAGKSTTFNLICGVAPASGGAVSLLGQRIAASSAGAMAALGLARTFQHVKLVADMSVLDNAALGAHSRTTCGVMRAMLRLDRAEERRIRAEAMRQLARVGLADRAHAPAGSLSLGGQRIVEIARALCIDPLLLLLDEPAAGLRLPERQALAALLDRLRAEGVGILLVEHDMDFVMTLADRLVVLDFGSKIAEGPPAAIRGDAAVRDAYLGGVA